MAVLNIISKQLDVTGTYPNDGRYPIDEHGKLRECFFELPPVTATGDANTTFELCRLPQGRVRVFPYLSRLKTSALGTGRTFDIGHAAYNKQVGADDEAADVDAFADGLDVSAAALLAFSATVLKYDIYSRRPVLVTGIVLGGTIPIGATMSGVVVYAYE